MTTRFATVLFVLIWSSGWVSAGFAMPDVNAVSFLTVRFALAAAVIGAFAFAVGARWPRTPAEWLNTIFYGVLSQGFYLLGVWWAIERGVPAGVSGLTAAIQPLLAAMLTSRMTQERLTRTQWLGIVLGFAGILLVLEPKLLRAFNGNAAENNLFWPIVVNILGTISATLGTLYQKACLEGQDIRSLVVTQAFGGLLPCMLLLFFVGPWHFDISVRSLSALGWATFVMSFGGTGLLLYLIRRGEVAKVSSLFFLMPPLVALEAWLILGEKLLPIQIAGMLVVMIGVFWATRNPAANIAR